MLHYKGDMTLFIRDWQLNLIDQLHSGQQGKCINPILLSKIYGF